MSNDLPHIANGHSPQEVSAGEILHRETDEMPEGLLDIASEFMEEFLPTKPEAETVEKGSVDELTADEIEAADEDLDLDEEVSDEESTEVVGYEELRGHTFKFKVGGETVEKTIDQIASELGQVKAASRVQNEVKEQREILQSEQAQLSDARELLRQQEQALRGTEDLSMKMAELNQYQQALQQARNAGDANAIVQIKDLIDMKANEYNTIKQDVEQLQAVSTQRVLAEESKKLQAAGYGHLLTDTAYQEQFGQYALDNLPTHVVEAANQSAELLIALDKAFRYDKAKSKKSNIKQQKGTNLKPSKSRFTPKEKEMSPDEAFQKAADRMLKGLI